FDELIAMASEHSSLEPTLLEMTLVTMSLGLVPNPPSLTPFVPPSRTDWIFCFNHLALKPAASTGSPSSTIVDQYAPSPTSSSSDVIPTIVHTAAPNSEHITKWTRDHPLINKINELKRPVSTRLQLHEQALFCDYDAFLTSVEPKNYKDALTQITYNGTEFVNQTLREYYEKVGISHETSVARSLQQNSVVERCNRTLIEAARTMLIYEKAPLFLWAEAVATACCTQNRSIIRLRHGKTPYELLHDKLPDLSFFHVFGALCYQTNNSKNLGKLQPKADIDFDELTTMAFEHSNLEPALHEMTPATISSGLVPNPPTSTPFVPPSRIDWDILF
ncbi:retrovirus-related pol polyprotein from transposon TNT 1-94, partial [Tanacetum coccineum]